ncbi:flagellar hook-length control protein FliK [Anaeromicropila populeti]|uniref:Flagellar hook-length control protein FliK n=1 Tax=Anaeromicropila populeti TaxID=37658 RepID=A0A1I6KXC4_9FIRM|nr:flagellar hook-length control protein FliK [Anaeromicropila populeti]SFR95844.1 flagellar hook-length control protein FliK [Anaeromicropila populeti]
MAQGLRVQGMDLLSNLKTAQASQPANKKTSGNFQDLMGTNIKSLKNEEKVVVKDSAAVKDINFNKAALAANKQETAEETKAGEMLETVGMETEDVLASGSEVLEGLELELKQKICDVLEISQEELEKLMQESGLTVLDLLNPENLQKLLFTVESVSDKTELLTNEDLLQELGELTETVDEFVKENEVILSHLLNGNSSEDNQFSAAVLESMPEAREDMLQDAKGKNVEQDLTKEINISVEKELEEKITETAGSGKETSSQDADSMEQSTVLNQFVNYLVQGGDSVEQIDTLDFSRVQQMREIVDQVVEQIKVLIKPDSTSMELQLNPEHLGKVNVSVVAKEGQMTAVFVVENQLAKEALESQMMTLKDNLSEQGLKVTSVEVTVANHGFEQNEFSEGNQGGFQKQNKRSLRSSKLESDADFDEEEPEESDSILQSGTTVEFSA